MSKEEIPLPRAGLDKHEILLWLKETDPDRLEQLWRVADRVRHENVGDEVHLRGLIEISNHCIRECGYCGLRKGNSQRSRYRMADDEILAAAHEAHRLGYGTAVMQSGEDYGITAEWMAEIIRRIKSETPLAVTLSLGERPEEDLLAWREAGADRYLLRFETSDKGLYKLIHPDARGVVSDRLAQLTMLKRMGYEAGSGVMIGIPGQTYECLARDIDTYRGLDLDMIGQGPYVEHPATPMAAGDWRRPVDDAEQVPATVLMTCKAVALARLACPLANIPSTTALATIDKRTGHELGLSRGANVVMPNVTPVKYRLMYQVYPGKEITDESTSEYRTRLYARIHALGRTVGTGPGSRRRTP